VDEVERAVKGVLAAVLNNGTTVEAIPIDADLIEDYGLDSLQTIAFLLGIEDACDVELDYENLELDHLRSVRAFVVFVAGLQTVAS
jgi:acyl carrier protein